MERVLHITGGIWFGSFLMFTMCVCFSVLDVFSKRIQTGGEEEEELRWPSLPVFSSFLTNHLTLFVSGEHLNELTSMKVLDQTLSLICGLDIF